MSPAPTAPPTALSTKSSCVTMAIMVPSTVAWEAVVEAIVVLMSHWLWASSWLLLLLALLRVSASLSPSASSLAWLASPALALQPPTFSIPTHPTTNPCRNKATNQATNPPQATNRTNNKAINNPIKSSKTTQSSPFLK
eukprot:m.41989 g.41989  ORF g.41989 m.41989 type:complete len:139 (+) comp16936_c0_seq1:171-587(+)